MPKEYRIKVIETLVTEYSVFAESPRIAQGFQEAGRTKLLGNKESRRTEISEIKEKKDAA